ncbi:phage head spike fiber domain-containing protein [Aeromonas aquatica]|uniref:phage head spike fiber domain-containing protein n=1 Tax=Aeromonas aquatica TaxID=558964 RepID=UPI00051AF825|nr:LamG-like jellyroll fold domain-containing protein [Aeromonas aquatica]
MAGLWQRTGNVTVTNGSKTVTGFGTKWKTGTLPIQKGHSFYGPDNAAYEVDTVVSDTEILLVEAYRGGTLANQPYRIDITRTSTISQFAADLASLVGKYRAWYDGMMAWLTGSGDVPILNPDTGTTITIPSWKKVASEGEGQAARAKVEADKAVAAAAVAVDVVRAAALPLPDVWIPLTDSLRMFTGYGREAKVGEDVVARYVNFSRATTATFIDKSGGLRVAAVNEPRFETEGLLVEGLSTNLTNFSEGWSSNSGATAGNAWSHTSKDSAGWITVSGGTDDGRSEGSYRDFAQGAAIQGQTATFSFDVKKVAGYKFRVSIFVGGTGSDGLGTGLAAFVDGQAFPSIPGLIVKDMGTWLRISITRKFGDGTSIFRLYPFGSNPDSNGSLTYRRVQVETQPYATSYIPTTGAAASRAADAVSIPSARNINPTNTDVTYAMQVEFRGVQVRPFRTDASISPSGAVISSSGKAWFFSDAATTVPTSSNMAVLGMNDFVTNNNAAGVVVCINGVLGGPRTPSRGAAETNASTLFIGAGQSLTDPINGHIRNFRIYHQVTTDAQIKAIR